MSDAVSQEMLERARKFLEERYANLGEKFATSDKSVVAMASFGEKVRRERDKEYAALMNALPLDSFKDDMGEHDAADFVDHAGEFFEAVAIAKRIRARFNLSGDERSQ